MELVTCIQTGRVADYNLARGVGRKISYDEYIKLLDDLDKYNLVHMAGNFDNVPTMICNCHNCCCGAFVSSKATQKHFKQNAFASSRFVATVEPEKCKGCRTCADKRCPVGAAQMKYYPEFGKELAYIDPDECIGCGMCVVTCPAGARKMKLVRPPEHVPPRSSAPQSIIIDSLGDD